MSSYILRDPDQKLWKAFKARAKRDGHPLRWVILQLIQRYVERGLD